MWYSNYQTARDKAWNILAQYDIHALPVKVTRLCKEMGIAVTSYQKSMALIMTLGLSRHTSLTDGFTVQIGAEPIIFYDADCTPARCRFTIAHELGHIVLGHLEQGRATALNREPNAADDLRETAANIFAARLLAPACVLWGMGAFRAEKIAEICEISHKAAAFRAERLQKLLWREKRFLKERGHSCFLQSPAERAVFARFKPYIEAYRSD